MSGPEALPLFVLNIPLVLEKRSISNLFLPSRYTSSAILAFPRKYDLSTIPHTMSLNASRGDHDEATDSGTTDPLDIIDELRAQDLGKQFSLPQLVVCGDQSSGKSSVLEAISGLRFPTKDTLCTRFAIELVLHRRSPQRVHAVIQPGPDRSAAEKEQLAKFEEVLSDADAFEGIVERAGEVMGLGGGKRTFHNDVLKVTIDGPDQQRLTLIDLPGIFHGVGLDQTEEDVQLVRGMVQKYIQKPHSIILAVVSAKNEMANQEVTMLTRNADRDGQRTLGIVTKPDLLERGTASESQFVSVIRNEVLQLKLGWHVIRNRNQRDRDKPVKDRDEKESRFFKRKPWSELPEDRKGIESLKVRLSRVLQDKIAGSLPDLIREIEVIIRKDEATLRQLSESSQSMQEIQGELLALSKDFTTRMGDLIVGRKREMIVEHPRTTGRTQRTPDIRSSAAQFVKDFHHRLKVEGRAYEVVDEAVDVDPKAQPPRRLRRSVLAEIEKEMRNRGLNPGGHFDTETASWLFRDYSKNWHDILSDFVISVTIVTRQAARDILLDCTRKQLADKVFEVVIEPKMRRVEDAFRLTLRSSSAGADPNATIDFGEDVEESFDQRFSVTLGNFLAQRVATLKEVLNGDALTLGLKREHVTCDGILASMEYYYDRELHKLITACDYDLLQRHLLRRLPDLFLLESLKNLSDSDLHKMVSNDSAVKKARDNLIQKLTFSRRAVAQLQAIHDTGNNSDGTGANRTVDDRDKRKKGAVEEIPDSQDDLDISDKEIETGSDNSDDDVSSRRPHKRAKVTY